MQSWAHTLAIWAVCGLGQWASILLVVNEREEGVEWPYTYPLSLWKPTLGYYQDKCV